MKIQRILCLALVLSGCAANKPAHPIQQAASINTGQCATRTSPWGQTENGLRCRVTLPEASEQGMSVPATVELQDDPAELPPGVRKLNSLGHDAFLALRLTDPKTGKQYDVKTFGFAGAPPIPLTSANLVALAGRPLKPWMVHFPLVRVYTNLAPGDYVCQATFSFSKSPTGWIHGTAFDPASWWRGTIVSGKVHMRVLPETPKFKVFYIPKRLVVTKELTNLHASDEPLELKAIPVIRFRKADAKIVRFRVRNGHSFYTWIDRQGTLGARGTQGNFVPVPDALNPIDQCYGYKGQDMKMDYRIKVCECINNGFEFGPGPKSPGYRLLWSRNFHVSLTAKEFRQLPTTVVNVPAKKDNRDCVALIRANPEVEDLSLHNTGITDAGLAVVGKLKHLRKLHLDDTRITDAGLAHLRHLTHLKCLYLDGTQVTDAGLLGLRRLTQLENLSLSNMAITDKGAAVVSEFPHLKKLDLINTRIGNATLSRLRNLKQLETLFLAGTRVSDEGLHNLIQLNHLQYLRLPTTITDKELETIKLALPDCTVDLERQE